MQPDAEILDQVGLDDSSLAETLDTQANGKANGADLNGSGPRELHEFLAALQAMRVGDFSVRMAGDHTGIWGKLADTFNDIVAANQRMAQQLDHVGQVV